MEYYFRFCCVKIHNHTRSISLENDIYHLLVTARDDEVTYTTLRWSIDLIVPWIRIPSRPQYSKSQNVIVILQKKTHTSTRTTLHTHFLIFRQKFYCCHWLGLRNYQLLKYMWWSENISKFQLSKDYDSLLLLSVIVNTLILIYTIRIVTTSTSVHLHPRGITVSCFFNYSEWWVHKRTLINYYLDWYTYCHDILSIYLLVVFLQL